MASEYNSLIPLDLLKLNNSVSDNFCIAVSLTYRFIELSSNRVIMNSTSPKSSLAKICLHTKPKPFRILILGTAGVGKTGNYSKISTHLKLQYM